MKRYTQYILLILLLFIIVVLMSDLIFKSDFFLQGDSILQSDSILHGETFKEGLDQTTQRGTIGGLPRPSRQPIPINSPPQANPSTIPANTTTIPANTTTIPAKPSTSNTSPVTTASGIPIGACKKDPNSDDCKIEQCAGSQACKDSIVKNAAVVTPTTGKDIEIDTSYSYINFIKTPKELGMSDKGSIKTLENDINGLISYVKILIEGKSDASKGNNKGPLGNKFFVKTDGKCNDINTLDPNTKEKDRYFYINNVPTGQIPFTSDVSVKDFRGLIPGMMEKINIINPGSIASAFAQSGIPDCQEITLETIDSKNTISSETHFVSLNDISPINPCLFPMDKNKKRINPVTKEECKEGFSNIVDESSSYEVEDTYLNNAILHDIETDYIAQLFLVSVGLYGLFLFAKTIEKIA